MSGAAAALALTACAERETGYFPVHAGRYLEYRVHVTTVDIVKDSRLTVSDLGPGSLQGKPVMRTNSVSTAQACGPELTQPPPT